MDLLNHTCQAFLELVRAGLWEDIRVDGEGLKGNGSPLTFSASVDWQEVYWLAEEQGVIGLVTAGLEHIKGRGEREEGVCDVPEEVLFSFLNDVLQTEQQNRAMNEFIADMVGKMRDADIYTLLVKGQGIAQCYQRPLWRTSGDVDLLLNHDDYEKAKRFLMPLASVVEQEYVDTKHLGMTIDEWVVELHGSLHVGLSNRINRVLDDICQDTFYGGNVRSWNDDGTQIFLLAEESAAFYVFVHFLNHFYKGGVGLRQIGDWCRLLWTYRDSLNYGLLESRIRAAGLMSEWKAFGVFAMEYLGMPVEAMPFCDVRGEKDEVKWKKKGERIMSFVMNVGNMGHNRDMSYFEKHPFVVRKCFSMGRRIGDLIHHARIFPLDSLRFFPRIMWNGLRSAAKGEG